MVSKAPLIEFIRLRIHLLELAAALGRHQQAPE